MVNNDNDNNDNKNNDENKENNNNNKVNLIEISKDNKLSNEGSIVNDNLSEHKGLIPIINPSTVKKNNIGEQEQEQEKEKENKVKEKTHNKKIKGKPISIIKKQNKKRLSNSNMISNRDILKSDNNKVLNRSVQFTQNNCFICEKPFYLTKLYCADCGIHFLCRKCIKSYYEDYIENKNNSKLLKCPFAKCDKIIKYDILKTILSENHQKIYEMSQDENNILNENELICNNLKFNLKNNDNNVKMYSERHVLDISSNMNFFMFKKSKDIFCPKCLKPNLFSKTNTPFIKCLNCNYKICKYCLKEYTVKHLDIREEGYCKVYFRRDDENDDEKNMFLVYLLQLLFVIAMYLFIYPGAYLFFYDVFKIAFRLNNNNKNFFYYIKKFLIILFSILFLIMSCPFILFCYPFFPALIALCDF